MNNILVTGGCGFIGSNFIRHMLKNYEYRIFNLDALTYAGNLENLKDIEKNRLYKFIYARIEDSLVVNKVIAEEKISCIVNFAAESHVDRSIMDSAPFIKTNVIGTQVLLDASRSHCIKKFIHISTDEVYGSLPETGYFSETTALAPNSPYSASKAASDLLLRAYMHTHNFPAIIVRCSNNYGHYQLPEKLIPLAISNGLHNEPIPLYGDGLQVRDWIYVDDFCSAIDLILHNGRLKSTYNVGGRSEKTNLEVVKTILCRLKKSESLIKFINDRPGHDKRYAMDISKINRELGWQPEYGFENGIEKTIGWYKKNTGWLSRVKSGEYLKYYEEMYRQRLNNGTSYVASSKSERL